MPLSNSLPFTPQEPAMRPRAKYSVVAVDGGSNNEPSPTQAGDGKTPTITSVQTQQHTETVTASGTPLPPNTAIVTATKIVEEQKPEKTVKVVVTDIVHDTVQSVSKPKVEIVNAAPETSSPRTAITTKVVTASSTVCPSSTPSLTSLTRSKSASTYLSTTASPLLVSPTTILQSQPTRST